MKVPFRSWLHWMLFRKEHNELIVTKENLRDIDARYSAKVSSLWRTPHVDSPWMDKFLALEKDYEALEQEIYDVYTRLYTTQRQIRSLLDLTI